MTRPIVFAWENFGPMHVDRCDAVAEALGGEVPVHGIEMFAESEVYEWTPAVGSRLLKRTLFAQGERPGLLRQLSGLIGAARRIGRGDYFLCHYERVAFLIFAWWLRLTGSRVYVMGCSKFDDMPRKSWRELLKRFFLLPYQGALSSGVRARDYLRLLRFPADKVEGEYNTLSIERVRRDAGAEPAPGGTPYPDRHFTVLARFVPKKNLPVVIDAYALYARQADRPRRLVLCGSGSGEPALRAQVAQLGIEHLVEFRGFLQASDIARVLGTTLSLLLVSREEQFGNVVIEAQAMGLPVIVSDVCGARDKLVRSGVNGFVVEPDNPEGLAYMLGLLDRDEALWRRMSLAAAQFAPLGDVPQFAAGVLRLTRRGSVPAA